MDASVPAFSISELRLALEHVLSRHFGTQRSIVRLDHHPSAYGSSSALEELQVSLDDGTMLQIMFKDLSRQALLETARQVKPPFLHDPLREIETYRTILASHDMGSATCYGAVVDAALGRYWLFLEKVAGLELYQVGDLAVWQKAAVWLADLHTRFAERELRDVARAAHLLIYDRDYYLLWMRRAREFLTKAGDRQRKGPVTIAWLSERYSRVVERLLSLPLTLIHGEFYASNILVRQSNDAVRICPVDWEMAAVGPGLMDVAALTAGAWSDAEKTSLAKAYQAALPEHGLRASSQEAFLTALDCCRLHLAVRWLGWSPGWSPPPEHAQDWLAEALRLAEKLIDRSE